MLVWDIHKSLHATVFGCAVAGTFAYRPGDRVFETASHLRLYCSNTMATKFSKQWRNLVTPFRRRVRYMAPSSIFWWSNWNSVGAMVNIMPAVFSSHDLFLALGLGCVVLWARLCRLVSQCWCISCVSLCYSDSRGTQVDVSIASRCVTVTLVADRLLFQLHHVASWRLLWLQGWSSLKYVAHTRKCSGK